MTFSAPRQAWFRLSSEAHIEHCAPMGRNYVQEPRNLFAEESEDIRRMAEEQLARMVRLRDVRRKVPVSVRLDAEVLEWLRGKGEGHLTRINDILANLMEAERRAGLGK
jgi:uncharacterized protein (DUF4415 family)